MKQPLGITFTVPPGQEATGVYESEDGIEVFEIDDPYLLSDGQSLASPLPVKIVDGPTFLDSMGRLQSAIPVSGIGPAPPDYGTDFVFVMRTTGPGETVTIPAQPIGDFDANVDWGDGTVTSVTGPSSPGLAHDYAIAGDHLIRISGVFSGIYFNNGGDKDKLRKVIQLGSTGWWRMVGAFYGCFASGTYDADYFTAGPCDTSQVVTWQNAMRGWTAVTTAPNLEGMSAGVATSSQAMFYGSKFDMSGLSLSHWQTSTFNNFSYMFYDANGSLIPLSVGVHNFDLSSMNTLIGFAFGAEFTTEAYDAILAAWAAQEPPTGLTVDFGSSTCTPGSAAHAARTELIEVYGWTISDGGVLPEGFLYVADSSGNTLNDSDGKLIIARGN